MVRIYVTVRVKASVTVGVSNVLGLGYVYGYGQHYETITVRVVLRVREYVRINTAQIPNLQHNPSKLNS